MPHSAPWRHAAGRALAAALLATLLACDSAPPTPTAIPATASLPAASTALPTATAVAAAPTIATTDTPAPPPTVSAATATALPPTEAVAAATLIPAPATVTGVPATVTAAPPTDTAVPATNTPAAPPAAVPTRAALPASPTARPAPATKAPTKVPATPTVSQAAEATNTPAGTGAPTEPPTPLAWPTVAGRVAGDMSEVDWAEPGKHQIAITFDAGAGLGYISSILQTLAQRNLHITFFVTGQWAEQNSDQVRAIVAAGHEIGNHSYSHPSFPKLSDAQMVTELTKTEAIFKGITGISTKPYWRPPFGDENRHVQSVAKNLGWRSIMWTWDSLDSVGQPKSAAFLIKRVTEASVQLDGAIILMHVQNQTSAEALPTILDTLAAKGLHVVTITQLLSP